MTEVSIEIALFAGTAFCEVSWRQWAIDSRDDEEDSVSIDDEEVWSMVINHLTLSVSQARREVVSQNDSVSAYPLSADQGCGNMGWNGGPADFPAPWGGAGGACFDEITVQVPSCAAPNLNNGPNHLGLRWAVLLDMADGPGHLPDLVQVPCSPPSVTIRFDSGIDQAESDESWAFSDVRHAANARLPSSAEWPGSPRCRG